MKERTNTPYLLIHTKRGAGAGRSRLSVNMYMIPARGPQTMFHHYHRCVNCEREWPRQSYTKTQLKKVKSNLTCRHCTHGPDAEDVELLDETSSPPGWHSETDYYSDYFDEHGRVLDRWRKRGVIRLMKLSQKTSQA